MKNLCFLSFIAILYFTSCGTLRVDKTSDFMNIANLSEINGVYHNRGVVHLLGMFDVEDYADSIRVSFPNDSTLILSYDKQLTNEEKLLLMQKDNTIKHRFSGKDRGKYFEIYFTKKQFWIPFIYSRINVRRLRIGKSKTNGELLIRRFTDDMRSLFIFGNGHSAEEPYIFKSLESEE